MPTEKIELNILILNKTHQCLIEKLACQQNMYKY